MLIRWRNTIRPPCYNCLQAEYMEKSKIADTTQALHFTFTTTFKQRTLEILPGAFPAVADELRCCVNFIDMLAPEADDPGVI